MWYWLRRFTALGATDLRKSIDGLAALVKESFHLDPFSRSLFFAVEDDYYRIVDDPERTISTRKGNSKSSKSRRLMPLCRTNMQVRFTHCRYSY
ncbi:MAG TPA: transposase [Firmicutes bacterium]|nr:transposase [Candidatus Fermentithermobacillaceae bacterium]